jgi:2-polyprenyl-3-methyl-5-hydroxy-6-metoxy-1,4-benzoquinol methylase
VADPRGQIANFPFRASAPAHTHSYVWPTVLRELVKVRARDSSARVFDLGCGNGAFAAALHERGFDVTAVDPSEQGVALARAAYPGPHFSCGSGYDDLASTYGRFPVVVSLEVVEHVFAPRDFAKALFDLVEDDGVAIISTPYHGYLKNLALAATGRFDAHFTALWDYGHIKFWSRRTLGLLLSEAGFRDVRFERVGRIPPLAKSMIAIVRR